jgi:3-isopropylmalate dehydrogenase
MGSFAIAALGGDGIGPEVTVEALRTLRAVGRSYGHTFDVHEALVGQAAIERHGEAITDETMALCQRCDAVLFGAVGGAGVGRPDAKAQPENALFRLRKELELFANLRPVRPLPALRGASSLKRAVLRGVDLVVIRELTGGLYYGRPSEIRESPSGASAIDTMVYTEGEIERVVRFACVLARGRRKRVTSVDKANVLSCSRLWRRVATRVGQEFPDVEMRHLLVDACAMNLIRQPAEFDVVVMENMFGDILTDEASMLAGSLGMLPSASLGTRRTQSGYFGLYEPIHGTAPDITGQGKANPLASILSVALLLRHSLGLRREAAAVERAVRQTLAAGLRTADIAMPGASVVSTRAMGAAVAERIADGIADRASPSSAGVSPSSRAAKAPAHARE